MVRPEKLQQAQSAAAHMLWGARKYCYPFVEGLHICFCTQFKVLVLI